MTQPHLDDPFLKVSPAATRLVAAVHAEDVDAARDILLEHSDADLWALTVALAAMVSRPDPERVLRYCVPVETRLALSARPQSWPMEDLQSALCVHRARTAPGALWVARGVREWARRRQARQAHLEQANRAALAVREGEKGLVAS